MKIYRNIYVMMDRSSVEFKGNLEIPYSGELSYGVQVEDVPKDFDLVQDVYYTCPCDLEEFKCFKKV